MKILLMIIALTVCPFVNAKTPWESYLDVPSAENAKNVSSIEYTEGAIPKGYGYWAPDLEILKNQVIAGDRDAFRLTYKLMSESDGGLLEELVAILASSIRPQPEVFLREIGFLNPSEAILKGILSMPGLEYVDRINAQEYELLQRKKAISSVTAKDLAPVKEKCLLLLK